MPTNTNDGINNIFIVKSGVEEILSSTYYPDKDEEENVYKELYGDT